VAKRMHSFPMFRISSTVIRSRPVSPKLMFSPSLRLWSVANGSALIFALGLGSHRPFPESLVQVFAVDGR